MKTLIAVLIVLGVLIVTGIILFIVLRKHPESSTPEQPVCPSGQVRCQDGKCYEKDKLLLCQGKCYDPKQYVCQNNVPLKPCGSIFCQLGENCTAEGKCVPICKEDIVQCDPNNPTYKYCYYVGVQKVPFKLYYGQRFYSQDYKFYIELSNNDLAVYNGSDQSLNKIVRFSGQTSTFNFRAEFTQSGINVVQGNVTLGTLTPSIAAPILSYIVEEGRISFYNKTTQSSVGLRDFDALFLNYVYPSDSQLPSLFPLHNMLSTDSWCSPLTHNYQSFVSPGTVIPYVGDTIIPASVIFSTPDGAYAVQHLATLSKLTLTDKGIIEDNNGNPLSTITDTDNRVRIVGPIEAEASSSVDCKAAILGLTDLLTIYNYCAANNYPVMVRDFLFYYYLSTRGGLIYGLHVGYPYLEPRDLIPDIPLVDFYGALITAWCKYYNTAFIDQPAGDRFGLSGILGESGAADVIKVRDYNINTSAGRTFCLANSATLQFCANVLHDLCYNNFIETSDQTTGDTDALNALKTYNLHPECDTCRTLYMTPGIYPDVNKLKTDIRDRYLRPYCQKMSSKFVDMDYRQCCQNNHTDECTQVNNLFTKNGNCSCFMGSTDLETLFGSAAVVAKAGAGALSPDCYSDCIQNSVRYYGRGAYDANTCKSKFCIIDQNNTFNIDNTNVGDITDKDVAYCQVLRSN